MCLNLLRARTMGNLENLESHTSPIPCAVAKILIDYGMDYETIAAALLHDVVEDTEMSREDITQRFGAVVAHLVDGEQSWIRSIW